MKKLILILSFGLLSACSIHPKQNPIQQDVKLATPTEIRNGYVRLVKDIN